MANTYIRYPSTSFSGSIGTVTAEQPNGALLHVTVDSAPAPVGAATSANQLTEIGLLTTIDADTSALAGCVSATNLNTAIQEISGIVDATNSSTTNLVGGASFTGTFQTTKNYASIQIGIKASANSATDGVEIQFSNDGVTVDHSHYYTYTAPNGVGYLFQPEFKYYRIKYNNGAIAQTSFTLSTTVRPVSIFPSQYRISTSVSNETQALMTKSVITGETTGGGGGFVNVKVNPSGALVADVTQGGTWNITNVTGTVSLPTGAATETTLSALNTKVTACNTGAVTVSSSVLPTGAATSAKQPALGTAGTASTDVITVQGIAGMTPFLTAAGGLSKSNNSIYNDYSTTNVTTSTYVQLVSSLTAATQFLDVFDSSGQAMILATGAAGSEVNVAYIQPGGLSLNLSIPAGTRISIKALTGNATNGYLLVNFRG